MKSWLFEKINKIDKPSLDSLGKKRRLKENQNEMEVTTETTKIQMSIRDYYYKTNKQTKTICQQIEQFRRNG